MGAATGGNAPAGLGAIFLVSGALELFVWTEQPGKEAGIFGDPAGLNQYTEDMRLKEINNGRMAMISILGIFGAELATGKDALAQFAAAEEAVAAVPVAFKPANEIGAMAPLGYFDPLG